jgi:hypothetical protein
MMMMMMMKGPIANLAKAARSFWQDTDGIILPYVTLMLVVIIGTSLLALDGGRAISLQSQLQKGADALAIAGAAELDRMPDSTDRAVAAINNLVTNSSIFGTGGAANVTVSQIRFTIGLPEDIAANIDAQVMCTGNACTAAQSVTARFVEVAVTPTTIPTILPASFLPGLFLNTVTAAARATAGMDQVVCDFTPMFICNPYATAEMTYDQATAALQSAVASPAMRRRQIEMRRGGGGDGQYSPGNYGFLDNPTLGNGANALRDAMAMVSPTACFSQNGVDTKPGFVASVRAAVNVRFDIYEGPMNSSKNDANFRPAKNVRKGYFPNAGGCNASQSTDLTHSMGLPRDTCFASTCPYMGGRMGDGDWNFEAYWTVNHTKPDGTMHAKQMVNGAQASNANLPSRYDVYRYEILQSATDATFISNPSGLAVGAPAAHQETGLKMCSGSTTNDDPDRRTFYAAIVNCEANLPPKLPLGPGNQSGVPVAAFGKFFITQPVAAAQDDILAEIVELVTPGSLGGHNFDQVQLYR